MTIILRATFAGAQKGIKNDCMAGLWQVWRHRCRPRPLHGDGYIIGVNLSEHPLRLAFVSQFNLMAIGNWYLVYGAN